MEPHLRILKAQVAGMEVEARAIFVVVAEAVAALELPAAWLPVVAVVVAVVAAVAAAAAVTAA